MYTITEPATTRRYTCWHVTEPERGHTYHVTNSAPHMLRWILEPHLFTHRLVAVLRRRASSGPSFLRLVLAPLDGRSPQLVVHAVLMRSFLPEQLTALGVAA